MDRKSIIGILIILLLFIGAIVYSFKTTEDVVLNGIDVTARILSFNNGVKSRGNFQCEINYKGKTIELIGTSSVSKGLFDYIGKTFPARFSPRYKKLELLITPKDFEAFGMPFPDSLKWGLNDTLSK